MLKFRGHHLVCLHFFKGEGYSREFVHNLQELVGRAQRGEPIVVVAGPDDVCRACPHLRKERCWHKNDAEAKIRKLDYRALRYLGASAGEKVTWEEIKNKVSNASEEWFTAFCAGCDWALVCNFVDNESLPSITTGPGAYILFIFLGKKQNIRVGALGKIAFSPGWYAYVGSAMGGLRARIYRHLKQDKKIRWHIDYFLLSGVLKEIFVIESGRKIESSISRCLAERLLPATPRFGAGDCSCKTHLFFAPTEGELRKAVEEACQNIINLFG